MWNAQMFLMQMWDPLEFPILVFIEEGRGLLSTPRLFKTKTKPHSCCLSEQSKKTFSVVVEAVEKCRAGRV